MQEIDYLLNSMFNLQKMIIRQEMLLLIKILCRALNKLSRIQIVQGKIKRVREIATNLQNSRTINTHTIHSLVKFHFSTRIKTKYLHKPLLTIQRMFSILRIIALTYNNIANNLV